MTKIKIENLKQEDGIPLFNEDNSSKDKEIVNLEKQKMKILEKHNKECKDSELIENCLLDHFFLRVLEKQARMEIIKEVTSCYAKEDTILFKQGDPPGHFFIIGSGVCEMQVDDKTPKLLSKGQCFGDISLIYGINRECTVKCKQECNLWVMEKRNFKKIIEHIMYIVYEDNNKTTTNNPLFKILDHDTKSKILKTLYRETHLARKTIYSKGDNTNCIYLIKDGEIEVKAKDETIQILKEGDYFGELSIISQKKRLLELVPKTKTHLYSFSIADLKNLGDNYPEMVLTHLAKAAFSKNKSFNGLNTKFLDKILNLFKLSFYQKESVILNKGQKKTDQIIIPISGQLFEGDKKDSKPICPKGFLLFGDEIYNEDNAVLKSDIKCCPYSLLYTAKTTEVVKQLGNTFKSLGSKTSAIEQLKRVHLFKNFTEAKLNNLSLKIKIDKKKDGENVITQGEEGTRFYIIKKGLVDIFVNDKYIRTMNENEYLGERALFFKEKRSATAKAHGDCEVFYLEKNDFETVIEKNLGDYLKSRLYLQDNTVQLTDLIYHVQLGSGSYGNVSLVKNKKNNFFYAIKNISNKQILYSQLHTNLELERSILLQIDHPFIVKLVKTLKDSKYIYFLMDYIKGKELFDVIRDIGLLNKSQTQFYAASMMLAVQYLHERKFVFRDIKPENIMVVDKGYIKLIDFGTAKAIANRTKTIIGTPHYMAPEVILGEDYSFQVDFWSIGICMYEFMCGGVPFGENAEDVKDIYLAIINDKLNFPNYVKDRDFKNLMQLMLNKNKQSRYSKLSQINGHIWFKDFNWDELISLNMPPAYTPTIEEKKPTSEPIPYPDYIKNLKDWEEPEDQQKISDKKRKEFDDWLAKF